MNTIGLKRYRIIFYGTLMPETDPQQARAALQQRYRLNEGKLEAVFSGRKVALQSDLAEMDAWRIQNELEGLGLVTHLEQTHIEHVAAPASPAVSASTPATVATPAPSPEPLLPTCRGCQVPVAEGIPFCRPCAAVRSRQRQARLGIAAAVVTLLAIAGWLAWQAIPLYHGYQAHAQVTRAIDAAQQVQAPLRDFIDRTGFWPNSNLDAGLPAPEQYANDVVDEVRIGSKALISVHLRESLPLIGNSSLLFVPQRDADGQISWRCDGGTLPAEYLPTACQAPDASAFRAAVAPTAEPLKLEMPKLPASSATAGPSPRQIQRLLSETLRETASVRRAMLQAMMLDAQWPDTNSQAGVPDARTLGPAPFRRIEVQPGGRLLYEFSDHYPNLEGHKLTLVPAGIAEWRCETTLPEDYIPVDCNATIR